MQRERYVKEFGIPKHRMITLEELLPNVEQIEDLLDDKALSRIEKALKIAARPTKPQIKRFFQERLASNQIEELSPAFKSRTASVLDALKSKLSK